MPRHTAPATPLCSFTPKLPTEARRRNSVASGARVIMFTTPPTASEP